MPNIPVPAADEGLPIHSSIDPAPSLVKQALELISDAKYLTDIVEFVAEEIQMTHCSESVSASRLGGGIWAIAKIAVQKLDQAHDILEQAEVAEGRA